MFKFIGFRFVGFIALRIAFFRMCLFIIYYLFIYYFDLFRMCLFIIYLLFIWLVCSGCYSYSLGVFIHAVYYILWYHGVAVDWALEERCVWFTCRTSPIVQTHTHTCT